MGYLDNIPISTYSVAVSLISVVVLLVVNRLITRVEKSKLAKFGKIRNFEAVPTESPIESPRDEAIDRGVNNIETRYSYIRRLALPLIIVLWFLLLIVPQLETIPKTYTSLIIGAITVLIGVAAKPMIENIFAGLVISFGKTVRIGDTVVLDSYYGTIEEISLTYTIIKVWDWRRYVVPNSRLIQKEFLNLSLNDRYVWANVSFTVGYDSDMELIENLAIRSVEDSSLFRKEFEGPSFWIMDLNKEGIECWIACWAETPSKAWNLKHQIRRNLIKNMKEAQIKTHVYFIEKTGA